MPSPHQIKIFKKYISRHRIDDRIADQDFPECKIIVVIPAYLEKKYIFNCLNSLVRSAENVKENIGVIIVVNASEAASDDVVKEQKELFRNLTLFAGENKKDNISFYPVKELSVPKKHAGVGYARKTGMDQAVYMFGKKGDYEGVIVSLDADTTVAPNYFAELQKYFSNRKVSGCSIFFEHPLSGEEKDAIILYELFLRYYKNALAFTGFPYAYHTVGSAFALRADRYVRAGGMPRKQAGEDFYLIQKVVQSGGYGELNTTTVYPSPRQSERVPFGTGPSVRRMMKDRLGYAAYDLGAFVALKDFFDKRDKLFGISEKQYEQLLDTLPAGVRDFLKEDGFFTYLTDLNRNCSTAEVLQKRFFELFNAFKVVKYLNFVHERYYDKTDVVEVSLRLLELKHVRCECEKDPEKVLKVFRALERSS